VKDYLLLSLNLFNTFRKKVLVYKQEVEAMKNKIWVVLLSTFISALILSACSEETGSGTKEEQDKGNQNDDKVQLEEGEVQASLLEFQDKIASVINKHDEDFKQFAQSVESETENLSKEELQALKNEAAQSSEALATELRNLEVPKELEAYSEELNQSLDGLAKEFEQQSENLSTEDVEKALEKTERATENFYKEFESGLASIYEDLGLETPNFLNQTE
jgi:hypothetical protein